MRRTPIPSMLNRATHVTSKVPNPRGIGLRVATTDATTKLGKATRNDTSWPTALSITAKVIDNKWSLAGFKTEVTKQEKGVLEKMEEFFLQGGVTPPSKEEGFTKFSVSGKNAFAMLVEQKRLIAVDKELYYHTLTLDKVKELVREHIKKLGPITAAQFRDITKTSRKFAIPLLEYFDAIHFTKRTGDVQILF